MNTLLICLIVCSLYSVVIYRVLSNRLNKKIDNKKFLSSVHEEINSLITQINETSDRNVMLLENRLDRLNNLLLESDKKLLQLKNACKSQVLSENAKESVEKITPVRQVFIEKVPDINKEMTDVADDPTLSRRERIILLHKQGISPTIIASQTKATIGEVELIISLSRG